MDRGTGRYADAFVVLDVAHSVVGAQRDYKSSNHLVSPPPDADGVRAADGLAGRAHDREQLAFTKAGRPTEADGVESWVEAGVMPTLNSFDVGDVRTTAAIVGTLNSGGNNGGFRTEPREHLTTGGSVSDDAMLPLGLDSHRYRCCGNGVVAPVAEWIGRQLIAALRVAA
jgi:site-specific DNA-cytosine methylase